MSQTNQPIKRHVALQPLSREHHHALLLVWKIRQGIHRNVPFHRIRTYLNWFYSSYLVPHIEQEEKHVYPTLDPNGILSIRAISEHRELQQLIESESTDVSLLKKITDVLETHIRFEERIVFPLLEEKLSEQELVKLAKIINESVFVENTEDCFWK